MSTDVHDLRATIIPRSDQLNSEQLLGGPMILTVSEVRAGGGDDQPVSVFYEADPGRPYKPCKTMRKVLILAWGADGTKWVGKSMELYCDPSVKFGGEAVGGIRISRLTDIPKDIKVSLTATKGRKAMHEIGRLELSAQLQGVLAAIGAATNGDSMKKAKAAAAALTNASDIAIARAAYQKKVAELKSSATTKADDVTLASIEQKLKDAATEADVDAVAALVEKLPDAMEQAQANALVSARYDELREPE